MGVFLDPEDGLPPDGAPVPLALGGAWLSGVADEDVDGIDEEGPQHPERAGVVRPMMAMQPVERVGRVGGMEQGPDCRPSAVTDPPGVCLPGILRCLPKPRARPLYLIESVASSVRGSERGSYSERVFGSERARDGRGRCALRFAAARWAGVLAAPPSLPALAFSQDRHVSSRLWMGQLGIASIRVHRTLERLVGTVLGARFHVDPVPPGFPRNATDFLATVVTMLGHRSHLPRPRSHQGPSRGLRAESATTRGMRP